MKGLKKVLSLANRGGTPAEAEAALVKAKEIAIRYNIDLASVDVSEEETKKGIQVEANKDLKTRSKYRQPYHTCIARVLMECFDVHVIWQVTREQNGISVNHVTIIGEKMDVAICKELFPWLEKIFPKTLSKAVSAGLLTYSMADTNGCYHGLEEGIVAANKKAEQDLHLSASDTNKYAMVLRSKKDKVEELVETLYPNLKSRRTRSIKSNYGAFAYGQSEGHKIKLGQMGGGAPLKRTK